MRSESPREGRGIEELVREVARVEVDPEGFAPPDRLERAPRGGEVIRDLGGVELEGEAHALGVEDVHDRPPAGGEVVVRARSARMKARPSVAIASWLSASARHTAVAVAMASFSGVKDSIATAPS
jgi:hypothetical protein